jgi:hypothetical protein
VPSGPVFNAMDFTQLSGTTAGTAWKGGVQSYVEILYTGCAVIPGRRSTHHTYADGYCNHACRKSCLSHQPGTRNLFPGSQVFIGNTRRLTHLLSIALVPLCLPRGQWNLHAASSVRWLSHYGSGEFAALCGVSRGQKGDKSLC